MSPKSKLGDEMRRPQNRKYRLDDGSSLLRKMHWDSATEKELHTLIMRFARLERRGWKTSNTGFKWRRRRIDAVAVYEKRFAPVPIPFGGRLLPKKINIYTKDGKHIWPFPKSLDVFGVSPEVN